MILKIAGAIAFVATAWYLIEFFVFAARFRRDNPSVWKAYGMPDSFGVKGQFFYLCLVFGWKSTPYDAQASQRARIYRLRCLFVVGIFAYLILLTLTI